MYTVQIVTVGSVEHKPVNYAVWIDAFMDVCDLERHYPINRLTAIAPTLEATITRHGAQVAHYDNLSGWTFEDHL